MKTVICILAMLVCVPCAVGAQTTWTLYPQDDTWVNEANPTANYGNSTYLSVKDRGGLAEAYIRFSDSDLAQLQGKEITSATLFLYQYQDTYSPGDTIRAYRITSSWNEATATWNQQPVYDANPASSVQLTSGDLQWRQWNGLEGCVAAWANGQNYGLALENNRDGIHEELFARFYSSEYSDQNLRPYLRVTTTPEPVSATLFLLGGGILSFIPLFRKK